MTTEPSPIPGKEPEEDRAKRLIEEGGIELGGGEAIEDLISESQSGCPLILPDHMRERYEPRGILSGKGGMGLIFRAFDRDNKREVAFKVVKPDYLEEPPSDADTDARAAASQLKNLLLRLFAREQKVLAQFSHPNIAPIFDSGTDVNGNPFFIMPIIPKGSWGDLLEQQIKRERPEWALGRTLDVFTSVCRAVAYAHSRSVVHRDLKPLNILLGDHEDLGEIYVIDWGLARMLKELAEPGLPGKAIILEEGERNLTAAAGGAGTRGYKAPEQEQERTEEIDERSDIYALGVILHVALTLKPPPDGFDPIEQNQPRPSSALDVSSPRIPDELRAVIRKATAIDRNERYRSVDELLRDISAFREYRPVSALPDPFFRRVRKWAKRNPARATLAGVGALVVLALCAWFAGPGWITVEGGDVPASVWINGSDSHRTSGQRILLWPAIPKVIELRAPGYETVYVPVRPQPWARVVVPSVQMERLRGKLYFTASQDGVRVVLSHREDSRIRKSLSAPGGPFEVPIGEYECRWEKEGCFPRRTNIRVSSDTPAYLHLSAAPVEKWRRPLPFDKATGWTGPPILSDVNGDGVTDVVLQWGGDDPFVICIDGIDGEIAREWKSSEGNLSGVEDMTGDGLPEFIFRGERTVAVVDPRTGLPIWKKATEAEALELTTLDVDQDGLLDIVVAEKGESGDHALTLRAFRGPDGEPLAEAAVPNLDLSYGDGDIQGCSCGSSPLVFVRSSTRTEEGRIAVLDLSTPSILYSGPVEPLRDALNLGHWSGSPVCVHLLSAIGAHSGLGGFEEDLDGDGSPEIGLLTVPESPEQAPGGEKPRSVLSVQSPRTDEPYFVFRTDGKIESFDRRDLDGNGVMDGILLVETKEQYSVVRLEMSPPKTPISGEIESRTLYVAGARGALLGVVALDDHVIGCRDTADDTIRWTAVVKGLQAEFPLLLARTDKSGTVVIAHTSTGFAGVSAENGKVLWNLTLPESERGGGFMAGTILIVGVTRRDWTSTVVDAATGAVSHIDWQPLKTECPRAERISTHPESFATAEMDGTLMFFAAVTIDGAGASRAKDLRETDLVAWSLRTGRIVWRVMVLQEEYSPPERGGGLARSVEVGWQRHDPPFVVSPAKNRGKVTSLFVSGIDGTFALDLKTRRLQKLLDEGGGSVQSLDVNEDGVDDLVQFRGFVLRILDGASGKVLSDRRTPIFIQSVRKLGRDVVLAVGESKDIPILLEPDDGKGHAIVEHYLESDACFSATSVGPVARLRRMERLYGSDAALQVGERLLGTCPSKAEETRLRFELALLALRSSKPSSVAAAAEFMGLGWTNERSLDHVLLAAAVSDPTGDEPRLDALKSLFQRDPLGFGSAIRCTLDEQQWPFLLLGEVLFDHPSLYGTQHRLVAAMLSGDGRGTRREAEAWLAKEPQNPLALAISSLVFRADDFTLMYETRRRRALEASRIDPSLKGWRPERFSSSRWAPVLPGVSAATTLARKFWEWGRRNESLDYFEEALLVDHEADPSLVRTYAEACKTLGEIQRGVKVVDKLLEWLGNAMDNADTEEDFLRLEADVEEIKKAKKDLESSSDY